MEMYEIANIYNNLDADPNNPKDSCYINLYELDVSEDNLKDADGVGFNGYIKFTKPINENPSTYKFEEGIPSGISCVQ